MRKIIVNILVVGFALAAKAQTINDRAIINNLCGCFKVDFKYAETFAPDTSYKFHKKEEITATAELALPIEVTDKKIVIQHLLIVGETMVVKHWREDWSFENTEIWKYKEDKTWVKESVSNNDVRGKWTQSVWEVADEPRYQGYSQFVNLDNKITWQNTTDAPLPRREYTVRNDYNILNRTNQIQITDSGYVHEQDNRKIIRINGVDKLLVQEKGYNTYKRINDTACNAAKVYWEKNKNYWTRVRSIWGNYLATHNTVKLKNKIDDMMLNDYLNILCRNYLLKKVSETDIDFKIKEEINRFM